MQPYVNSDYQICPHCGSGEVHKTDWNGFLERCVLYLWEISPYRCRSCYVRFYRRTGAQGRTQTKIV